MNIYAHACTRRSIQDKPPEDNSQHSAIYRKIMKTFDRTSWSFPEDDLVLGDRAARVKICTNCGQIILVLLTGFPTQRCCSLVGSLGLNRRTQFPSSAQIHTLKEGGGRGEKWYTHFVTMNARVQVIFILFYPRSHTSALTWHKPVGLLYAHAPAASVKRFLSSDSSHSPSLLLLSLLLYFFHSFIVSFMLPLFNQNCVKYRHLQTFFFLTSGFWQVKWIG